MQLATTSGGTAVKLLDKETFYFNGSDPLYSDPNDELSYNLPANTSLIVFAGPDPDKSYNQYGGFCFTLSPGQTISNKHVNVHGNGSPALSFTLIEVTSTIINVAYYCAHSGYGSFRLPSFISFYGCE